MGPPGTRVASERVLWDVVEEHLDEASFLFKRWTGALDSAQYTLASLSRGLEARLLAQVDALQVNDPALLERLPPDLTLLLRGEAARPAPARATQTDTMRIILPSAHAEAAAQQEQLLHAALFGSPLQHAMLVQSLSLPEKRHAALFALGYTGQLSLVPVLLSQLTRPDMRAQKLAAEAFGMLTGLDTSAPPYVRAVRPAEDSLPALEVDRDRNLVPSPVDYLPMPHERAIAAWWREHERALAQAPRVLLGVPWTPELVLRALEILPLRRRHALATWLEGHSGGRAQIDTRALCRTQVKQLAHARALLTPSVV